MQQISKRTRLLVFVSMVVVVSIFASGQSFAASGGGYNVPVSATSTQGSSASGGGYALSGMMTADGGGTGCGTYNATSGLYSGTCSIAVCGNGIIDPYEACDDGSDNDDACPATCSDTCTIRRCSSSSGGGGGGGGGMGPVAMSKPATELNMVEASAVRTIASQAAGTITLPLSKIAITDVTLRFSDFTEFARINVQQLSARPEKTPEVGRIYKYFAIETTGLNMVDERTLTFAVPKSWMATEGALTSQIVLYRNEERGWVPYTATLLGETTENYRFSVSVPGFSYFAIGATGSKPAINEVKNSSNTTVPATAAYAVTQTGTEPAASPQAKTAETTPLLVEQPAASTGTSPLLWIAVIVVIAAIIGGLFFFQKKRKAAKLYKPLHQEQPEASAANVASQPTTVGSANPSPALSSVSATAATSPAVTRAVEHDPTRAVFDYIIQMRASGTSDTEIRTKLLSVGWDPLIIDMELMKQ